jgi:RNA polymerase sigma-70 factor (ECF subfamily)
MEPEAVNRELIDRARGGDPAALGELLQNYRGYLWGLADRMLDDRAAARLDASDIVQQTCLSVHKQITEFEGQDPAQFAAWLRQIHERNIRNAARNELHAGKRAIDREKRVSDGDVHAARQATASQQVVRSEESARLTRAIALLPPDEQEALRRRYLDGESMVEIAAAMGLTKDALIWLMKRAMTSLREHLAEPE